MFEERRPALATLESDKVKSMIPSIKTTRCLVFIRITSPLAFDCDLRDSTRALIRVQRTPHRKSRATNPAFLVASDNERQLSLCMNLLFAQLRADRNRGAPILTGFCFYLLPDLPLFFEAFFAGFGLPVSQCQTAIM